MKMLRFGLATALLLAIPSFAQAQHATGSFRAAPVVAMAAPAPRTAGSASARTHSSARTSTARVAKAGAGSGNFVGSNGGGLVFGGDPLSVQQLLNPFPGFGFDFEHPNGINRNANIKALIDPATQVQIAEAERRRRHKGPPSGGFIFLAGGGAYALPVDAGAGIDPDDPQTAQDSGSNQTGQTQGPSQDATQQGSQDAQRPIIIVEQQADREQAEGDARLAEEQSASLPDEGEFTLILRSGQEIEAVAFTRVNDRIVYITLNGGRRTVAVREVDIDATVRLNQERGTPLQMAL
jgi:hypothetical protein